MSTPYSNRIFIELDVRDAYGADVYAVVLRQTDVDDAEITSLVKNFKNSEFVHKLGSTVPSESSTHLSGYIQDTKVFDTVTQTTDDLRANVVYGTYAVAINAYKKTSNVFNEVGYIHFRDPPVLMIQGNVDRSNVTELKIESLNFTSDMHFKHKLVLVNRTTEIPDAFLNYVTTDTPFVEISNVAHSTDFVTRFAYDMHLPGKYTEIDQTRPYDLLYVLQNVDPNGEHVATRVDKIALEGDPPFTSRNLTVSQKSFGNLKSVGDSDYSLDGSFTVPEIYANVEYYIVSFKQPLPLNFENNGAVLEKYLSYASTHPEQVIRSSISSLLTDFTINRALTRVENGVVSAIDPNAEHYAYLCLRDTVTNERSSVHELVMNTENTNAQLTVNLKVVHEEHAVLLDTRFQNTSNVDIYVTAVSENVLTSATYEEILLYMAGGDSVAYGQTIVYPNPYTRQVYQGVPSRTHHVNVTVEVSSSGGKFVFQPPVESFVRGHSYYFENGLGSHPLIFNLSPTNNSAALFQDNQTFTIPPDVPYLYAHCINHLDMGSVVNGINGIPVSSDARPFDPIRYYTGNIHDPLEYVEITHRSEQVYVVMVVIDEQNQRSSLNTALIPMYGNPVETPIVPIDTHNVHSHYTHFEVQLEYSTGYVFLTDKVIPLDSTGMLRQPYIDNILHHIDSISYTDLSLFYDDLSLASSARGSITPNMPYNLYALMYNTHTKQKYFRVLDVISKPPVSSALHPTAFLGQVPNYITTGGDSRKMRRAFNGIYQGEGELHEWVAGGGNTTLWGWVDLGRAYTVTGLKMWQNDQLPNNLTNRTIHDFKLHFTNDVDQTDQHSQVHTIHFSADKDRIEWKFADNDGNLQTTNGYLGGQNDDTRIIQPKTATTGYHVFEFDQFGYFPRTGRYVYIECFTEAVHIESPRLFELEIYGYLLSLND